MSKERALLEKILATGWLNNIISCEVEELLAQPEQEPVAWRWKKASGWAYQDNSNNGGEPLYASPTRKRLSVDRLAQLYALDVFNDPFIFARQVEKAHGIG